MRAAKQAAGGSEQWTSLSIEEVGGAVPSWLVVNELPPASRPHA